MKPFQIKLTIAAASFFTMLLIDLSIGEEAEYFNLFYFIRDLISENDYNYSIYKESLGAWAAPAALIMLSLFHISLANLIYHTFHKISFWRKHV